MALSCFSARPAEAHVCQYVVPTISAASRITAATASFVICLFTLGAPRCVGAVGDQEQAREQDEVRDHARAAVADERKRDPRERDQPQDAADDDERLQGEAEGEPGRGEL